MLRNKKKKNQRKENNSGMNWLPLFGMYDVMWNILRLKKMVGVETWRLSSYFMSCFPWERFFFFPK